jgi:tetratricopeptide (TPR) repeat protein
MAKWRLSLFTFFASVSWCQTTLPKPVELAGLNPSPTDQQIQTLQRQVRELPNEYQAYDGLGSAYTQKARETGDIAYFNLAEQALKKVLDLGPQDTRAVDPLVHLALVCMGEHRFTDALAFTQKAIALGSGNLAAFAIEGDAYTDLGEYEEAAVAYNTVRTVGRMTSSPETLAYMSDSRLAYLRFLHGDGEGSIALMKSAITAGLQLHVAAENLAWLYFELGERYFQSGDLCNAALSYQSGLTADPTHYRSLAGLARVRAAQGKLEDSIGLYRRSLAIIPFPAYIEELGDVYRKAGRENEARLQYDLVEYIGQLGELNRVVTNRELAMFYANQEIKLPQALALAQKELDLRHDVYTWDALAWVLYKNGRTREAAQAMDKALVLHTNDPLLLFHAGMIYQTLGQTSNAEAFLARTLKINPHFDIAHAETATRTLEDIAQARRSNLRSPK